MNLPPAAAPWRATVGVCALAMVAVLSACGGSSRSSVAEQPSVTSVTISGEATRGIAIEATDQLSATVTVVGGAAQTVTWSSSDTSVATVSAEGLITGIAGGTSIITATSTADTSKSANVTVTVTPLFYLAANGVTVLCPNAKVGDTGEIGGMTYTKRERQNLKNLIEAVNWDAPRWPEVSATCTSGITDMRALFGNIRNFNGSIDTWDTSNVTDMSFMFNEARAFNQDISKWDTSKVTLMKNMFDQAVSFNRPIGDWNTSNVTDMSYMFREATAFNQDISGWDSSKVTTMLAMFEYATAFNQPIGRWNTSNVTDTVEAPGMARMFNHNFRGPGAFNQDLSSWCVTTITSEPEFFNTDGIIPVERKPVWGTCPTSNQQN